MNKEFVKGKIEAYKEWIKYEQGKHRGCLGYSFGSASEDDKKVGELKELVNNLSQSKPQTKEKGE